MKRFPPDSWQRLARAMAIAAGLPVLAAAAPSDPPLDVFETQRVLLENGGYGDLFGTAIALSGDRLAVGAPEPYMTPGEANRGRVDVFKRSGTTWLFDAQLSSTDTQDGDFFGGALDASADRIVIGAPRRDEAEIDVGAAFVFERTPSGWVEAPRLSPSDSIAWLQFGSALAIDGQTIIVGGAGSAGWAYTFEKTGTTWSEANRLEPLLGADMSASFGAAIDADSRTVVVGAPGYDGLGLYDAGAAYIFEKAGPRWVETAMLVASDPTTVGSFGQSVSIHGTTILVGSVDAAYVFELVGGAWVETQRLTPSDGVLYSFGASVATTGEHCVIGQPAESRACVFRRTASGWLEESIVDSRDSAGGELGKALAWDGEMIVAGAPKVDAQAVNSGAAYVFRAEELYASYCFTSANSTGAPASIAAQGSASVAANDFVLSATSVPGGQYGVFFYGSVKAQVPFGDGLRCVAGGDRGIGRLPVVDATGSGLLRYAVDWGNPPSATTQVTPGSTWNFQAWFRDPAAGGTGFNLSDALQVVFRE